MKLDKVGEISTQFKITRLASMKSYLVSICPRKLAKSEIRSKVMKQIKKSHDILYVQITYEWYLCYDTAQ